MFMNFVKHDFNQFRVQLVMHDQHTIDIISKYKLTQQYTVILAESVQNK